MVSGLSKWSQELKRPTGKDDKDYIESKPIMCECGYKHPIGGDGGGMASFFYDDFEWVCGGCGRLLIPHNDAADDKNINVEITYPCDN